MKAEDLWKKIKASQKAGTVVMAAQKGAKRRRDFLYGQHWTHEELQEWSALDTRPWTYDDLGKNMASLLDQVDVEGSVPVVKAENPEDKAAAAERDAAYQWFRADDAEMSIGAVEEDALEDLMLHGVAWTETYSVVVDGQMHWRQEVVPVEEVRWDPDDMSVDFKASQWRARGRWLNDYELGLKLPAHARKIRNLAKNVPASGTGQDWSDTVPFDKKKGYFVIYIETREESAAVRLLQPTPEEAQVVQYLGMVPEADGSYLFQGPAWDDYEKAYKSFYGQDVPSDGYVSNERGTIYWAHLLFGNKILFRAVLQERMFRLQAATTRIPRTTDAKLHSMFSVMETYQRQIDTASMGEMSMLGRVSKGVWLLGEGVDPVEFENNIARGGAVIAADPSRVKYEGLNTIGLEYLDGLGSRMRAGMQERIGLSKYSTGTADDLRRVSGNTLATVIANAAAPIKPFLKAWVRLRKAMCRIIVRQMEVYLTAEQWFQLTGGQSKAITALDIVVEIGDTKAVRRQKSIELLLGQGLLPQLETLQGGALQLPAIVLGRAIGNALNLDPNDQQEYEASILAKVQAAQQQPVGGTEPPQEGVTEDV